MEEFRETRPSPDPTTLTIDLIRREMTAQRELLETRIDALEVRQNRLYAVVDQRDPAIRLAIEALEDLFSERFHTIDVRFSERDSRFMQVGTEFAKSTDKNEQFFAKQIEAMRADFSKSADKNEQFFTKQIDALKDRLDDMRNRMTATEARDRGINQTWAWIVTAVGVGAGVLSILFSHVHL